MLIESAFCTRAWGVNASHMVAWKLNPEGGEGGSYRIFGGEHFRWPIQGHILGGGACWGETEK